MPVSSSGAPPNVNASIAGRAGYQEPHFRLGSGRDGVQKAGDPVRSSAPSGEAATASRAMSADRFHFSVCYGALLLVFLPAARGRAYGLI